MAKALALVANDLPAHVQKGSGLGNENVGNNVTIPRIKLLQKMSDEVDKYSEKHVAGAEPGQFINSLTSNLYGEEMYVISLLFKNEHVVWRKRDAGGGLLGAFASYEDAQDAINQQEKPQDYDITETHSHILLIKDPETGELDRPPVIMDFSSSKLRVSRSWSSQLGSRVGTGCPVFGSGPLFPYTKKPEFSSGTSTLIGLAGSRTKTIKLPKGYSTSSLGNE